MYDLKYQSKILMDAIYHNNVWMFRHQKQTISNRYVRLEGYIIYEPLLGKAIFPYFQQDFFKRFLAAFDAF